MKIIGVICGGFSSEYEISVKSATNIRDNFPDDYRTELILLSKDGWFVQFRDGTTSKLDSTDFTFDDVKERKKIDACIVYIHGDPGENGKIQAYLEMIDMPYINSGPLPSQLSFDKWYCNQFLKGFGFHVAESVYLTNSEESIDSSEVIEELGLPIFVKPCDSGSSYGIAKVENEGELIPAIQSAFQEGRTVILESFLDGVEVTCGVYRSVDGVEVLPITEIVTENTFFDYEAKYNGESQEITPARISDEETKAVQEVTKKIYDLLQLRSLARVDFMLVKGVPYIIEVNTTPGFSNESIVPKMIEAEGISVKEFWQRIVSAEL